MPISRAYNAIFVHIPKTGGTSIEDMLNIRYSRKDPKSNFFNVLPTREMPAYQHFLPSEIEVDMPDDAFRFTIVRNPWDRFASAYAFVHRHRLPVKRSTPIDQLIFAEDVARRRELYHEPYHEFFIPQTAYIDDIPGYFDAIYSFDAFDDAVRDIQRRLGCKKGARHINQRRPEDEVVPTDDKNTRLVFERVYGDDLRAWKNYFIDR